jgi:predicted DCC family thiol-disulfide oxidoreductase YuxK
MATAKSTDSGPLDKAAIPREPSAWDFQVLFDGQCPFCQIEARWLSRLNRRGRLSLVDITRPDFQPELYGRTMGQLMGSLHGVFPDGRMTQGVETFRQAYRAVGLGWLLAPTGWPILRPVFDFLYGIFARYRVRMGRLFGRPCTDRCSVPANRSPAARSEL